MSTARVAHSCQIKKRLDRAILPLPAVQAEKHDVSRVRPGHDVSAAAERTELHLFQHVLRWRQRSHHTASQHRPFFLVGERAPHRVDSRHDMTSRAQGRRNPQSRCERHIPFHRRASHQHRNAHVSAPSRGAACPTA